MINDRSEVEIASAYPVKCRRNEKCGVLICACPKYDQLTISIHCVCMCHEITHQTCNTEISDATVPIAKWNRPPRSISLIHMPR